jgi:hypothetical protein
MKKILIYFNFIVISILVIAGFLTAQTPTQFLSAYMFFPLFVYFGIRVFPRRTKAIILPSEVGSKDGKAQVLAADGNLGSEEAQVLKREKVDANRRMFLKLIGSAGLGVFMLSIFTKKAEAAFFGSVPGPGTVSIKNTAGVKIDPAEKHPTDGYKIAQLDDSVPAYYGFTDKNGAWFIMREEANGSYRYTKGSSNFSTGWGLRNTDQLTYDYYEEIFS